MRNRFSEIHTAIRAFRGFGTETEVVESRHGGHEVPVFHNEFWTRVQRGGHSLHEISYRACYKPQLPGFFLSLFGKEVAGLVYDPFMGRGTTLIEARLQGWEVCGNDVNPLCQHLVAPRLDPPAIGEVESRLQQVSLANAEDFNEELLVFFSPKTLSEICGWRGYFHNRRADGTFDRVDAWIEMVAANRLTGHSRGFFSVYTLPPNHSTSISAQRRINARRSQSPDDRDTRSIILKKSRQLLKDPIPEGYGRRAKLLSNPADSTPEIDSDSVAIAVTSPPFLNVVDYFQDHWLRNWFCRVDLKKSDLWQIGSLEKWKMKMEATLAEMRRVLRPGGVISFEVGEVRKGKLDLESEILRAGIRAGLAPEFVLIHKQEFTKTANCWGVSNNQKGTNTNRVVVFTKD